ncbi:MAG TPA: pitrilysin family protein [Myxococcota bacterium]|nr:pitrilysin family protein [Myxococcota bacterium]
MKKVLGYNILFLLFSCQAFALAPSAPTDISQKLSIPVEKYTLDNGLTMLLAEDHSEPFVAVNIWYFVGSINEKPRKTGWAHLFEHLMFEGSKYVPGSEHFRILEKIGGFDVNATTGFERTNYYETVPKSQLPLILAMESSRMFFLNITKEKLDEQRAVVRREREQRVETAPYGVATLKLWQSIFLENHPFHGRVIGSHNDLEAASLRDVQNFYDFFYGPSNAAIALVGDFDKAEALSLINKYFGSLPRTRVEPVPLLPKVDLGQQEIIVVDEKLGKLPLVRMQYVTPALFQPGDAELDVISHILTGGEFGRLTKAITRDKQMASSTSAYQQSHQQLSIFTIDTIVNPGIDPRNVIIEIDRVLADLVKNAPTSTEIERAKNSILTTQFFSLQSLGGQSGRAELLQTYNRFADDPNFIQQDIGRYKKITQESLLLSATRYLPVGKSRKILIATPAASGVALKTKRK